MKGLDDQFSIPNPLRNIPILDKTMSCQKLGAFPDFFCWKIKATLGEKKPDRNF